MQPFGHSLGRLYPEAVDEQLLGELAVGLELGHQLGDLVAGGDRLDRDDVGLTGAERAVEVGQADPVVLAAGGGNTSRSSSRGSPGSNPPDPT